MEMLEAFKRGAVQGMEGVPERHVETVMSDLFLCKSKVYKIYKHQNNDFCGDLTNRAHRKDFFTHDYTFNKALSPSIHVALHSINQSEKVWSLTEAYEEADDFCIEMNRIDNQDTLVHRLLGGNVTEEHILTITQDLIKNISILNKQYIDNFSHILKDNWADLWLERMTDLRVWALSMDTHLTNQETNQIVDTLTDFAKTHPYFQRVTHDDMTVAIDSHAGNIVFVSNEPQFIDVFWPKESWRVNDLSYNLVHTAACVRALGSDELADRVYETYAQYKTLPPPEVLEYYECCDTYLKAHYYCVINEPELSEKYFQFADAQLQQIT